MHPIPCWIVIFLSLQLADGRYSLNGIVTSPTIAALRRELSKPVCAVPRHAVSLRGGAKNAKKRRKIKSYKANVKRGSLRNGIIYNRLDKLKNALPSFNSTELIDRLPYTKSVLDLWDNTPPATQLFVGSSIFLTVLSLFFNGNSWPGFLDVNWNRILTRLEFWRLIAAFLYLGPFGLNYMLTLHFIWTYMSELEKLHVARPEEFLVMLGFGSVVLILSYIVFGISPKFLGHNMGTYLMYLWSRANEGTSINMMDLFVIQAEFLPWFFSLQALVIDGEFPTADIIGIAAGHLYNYYLKSGLLEAPDYLRRMIPASFITKYRVIADSVDNDTVAEG